MDIRQHLLHPRLGSLEQKILELLPLLSEDAKFKARLILGENLTKRKENEIITDEEVRVAICKALNIVQ